MPPASSCAPPSLQARKLNCVSHLMYVILGNSLIITCMWGAGHLSLRGLQGGGVSRCEAGERSRPHLGEASLTLGSGGDTDEVPSRGAQEEAGHRVCAQQGPAARCPHTLGPLLGRVGDWRPLLCSVEPPNFTQNCFNDRGTSLRSPAGPAPSIESYEIFPLAPLTHKGQQATQGTGSSPRV